MADPTQRLAELLQHPDTLSTILKFVANGGCLTTLCTGWDVDYSEVWMWLTLDPARKAAYDDAIKARSEWEHEVILAELRAIALFDLSQLYDKDGKLLPVSTWSPAARKAVANIDTLEETAYVEGHAMSVGTVRKIKGYDKLRAIELLGKTSALKLFAERHVLEASQTLEQLVAGSYHAPAQPGQGGGV